MLQIEPLPVIHLPGVPDKDHPVPDAVLRPGSRQRQEQRNKGEKKIFHQIGQIF
jgi:hypothetical protein